MDVFEANLCVFNGCDPLIPNTLYLNSNGGTFIALDSTSSLVDEAMQSPGSSWGDYDNDGDMDVYVLSMMDKKDILFRNEGGLEFSGIYLDPDKASNKWSYNSSWGDLNNDGDLDIIVEHGNGARPFLVYIYVNRGNKNHWLNISCEGTISNRSAIGTRIKVKAKVGEKSEWMLREISQENGVHACNGPRLHFGLGNAAIADSVIIRWANGTLETYTDIAVDHFYKKIGGQSFNLDMRIEK